MSAKKKTKDGKAKTKKVKRIPEATLFATAAEREEAARREAAAKTDKVSADKVLIEQMQLRDVRSLESDKFGEFTRITLVQPEPVEYNSNGLWKDLSASKRPLAFDRLVNLNALPEEARKKVIDVLTKEELKSVTTHELNIERLAKSVKEGKIDPEVVQTNSFIKPIAPHITISHGSGS